jgi:hypothetical protein
MVFQSNQDPKDVYYVRITMSCICKKQQVMTKSQIKLIRDFMEHYTSNWKEYVNRQNPHNVTSSGEDA